ncbi:unnamed protein product [Lathyrus oleraceus]
MTSFASKLYTIFIFFCLVILLISTQEDKEGYCVMPSKVWSGPCVISLSCDVKCINSEQAIYGACVHFDCFCLFNCSTLKLQQFKGYEGEATINLNYTSIRT